MRKQRTVKEITAEIKELRKTHEKNYSRRKFNKTIPMLFSLNEIESLMQITWLEGYLRAMRDERGLK